MLAKSYRLRKVRDFSRVYRQGTCLRSSCFTLFVCPRNPKHVSEPIRIGVIVGHKVSKRAVVRNRVKRRIRAVCRTLIPNLKSGLDVVITAKSSATQCEYSEFLQQLKQLFTNAEILHGY